MNLNLTVEKLYESAVNYYKNLKLDEAEKLLCQINRDHPDDYDVFHFLGIINLELKKYVTAIKYFEQAVQLNPLHKSAFYNLGYCHQLLDNYDEAIQNYLSAILLDSGYIDAIINCGVIYLKQNKIEEAESYFNYCLSVDPHCHEALNNLGNLKMKTDQYEDAVSYYSAAAEIKPDNPLCNCNLGKAYESLNLFDEAISAFEQVLLLEENNTDACTHLGNIFLKKGDTEKAQLYFNKSGDQSLLAAAELTNKGVEKLISRDINEAISYFDKAIALHPEIPEVHYNKSHALLLSAQFDEGFREYEWRLKRNEFKELKLRCPLKDEHSVSNKRILIIDEQGVGDTIQFIRLISLLKERGAYTIFCCKDSLLDLISNYHGIDEITPMSHGVDKLIYDYDVFLLSLAHYFHLNEDRIPKHIPYIFPEKHKLEKWKNIINVNSNFKVGIVWAGNPKHTGDKQRSCRLSNLFPLFEIKEAEIYSLQKGEAVNQLKQLNISIKDLDSCNQNFSDACAAINFLDLVITVDTSIAHLSAAMGKETWVMLPYLPDWRWMLNRNDSPWYPDIKLFRQKSPGNWHDVVAEIKNHLLKKVKGFQ